MIKNFLKPKYSNVEIFHKDDRNIEMNIEILDWQIQSNDLKKFFQKWLEGLCEDLWSSHTLIVFFQSSSIQMCIDIK